MIVLLLLRLESKNNETDHVEVRYLMMLIFCVRMLLRFIFGFGGLFWIRDEVLQSRDCQALRQLDCGAVPWL